MVVHNAVIPMGAKTMEVLVQVDESTKAKLVEDYLDANLLHYKYETDEAVFCELVAFPGCRQCPEYKLAPYYCDGGMKVFVHRKQSYLLLAPLLLSTLMLLLRATLSVFRKSDECRLQKQVYDVDAPVC